MSRQRSRAPILALSLVVGTLCAVGFGGMTMVAIALSETVAVMEHRLAARQVVAPKAPNTNETEKLTEEVARASEYSVSLERQIEDLESYITEGYVSKRRLTVTEANKAYGLMEPKLKLSVAELSDRSVRVRFGDQAARLWVAQRQDFRFENLHCYLLLESATRDHAEFDFGCEPQQQFAVEVRG